MASSISGLKRPWSVQGCPLRQEGEAGVPGVRSALGKGVYTWLVGNSSGCEDDGVTGWYDTWRKSSLLLALARLKGKDSGTKPNSTVPEDLPEAGEYAPL